MKTINPDVIPAMEFKDVIADECVAIGVVDAGVLIHYMERDAARLIEWEDAVMYGLTDVLKRTEPEPDNTEVKEIDAPASLV